MATKCELKPQENIFLSDGEWEETRTTESYDYIIVGSSFCATGFVYQTIQRNPVAKILIIERGKYRSSSFFQNLHPQELRDMAVGTEDFPWSDPEDFLNTHNVRGVNFLFGGRSCFWKAWCPQPTTEEMAEWPNEVIHKVHEYFPKAKELLSVQHVNEIVSNGEKPFKQLQEMLYAKLNKIEERIQHAPLAIVQKKSR